VKVIGISGSLRKGSYNTMALRAAQKLAPAGMEIEIADIAASRCTTTTCAPPASRPK
jgi:NAD(P)H-dependent FMN reductase